MDVLAAAVADVVAGAVDVPEAAEAVVADATVAAAVAAEAGTNLGRFF